MSESEKKFNLTRRKFVALSSASIAAPLVMKETGMVPPIEAAEKKDMKSIAPIHDAGVSYPEIDTYEKYYAWRRPQYLPKA